MTGRIYGQQQSDTLCLPTNSVRAILIDAEKGKEYKKQVDLLNQRIVLVQSQMKELEQKDSAAIAGFSSQIKTMNEEIALYKDQINGYERMLKRERFKRKMVTVGGVVATGLTLFLTLKK